VADDSDVIHQVKFFPAYQRHISYIYSIIHMKLASPLHSCTPRRTHATPQAHYQVFWQLQYVVTQCVKDPYSKL